MTYHTYVIYWNVRTPRFLTPDGTLYKLQLQGHFSAKTFYKETFFSPSPDTSFLCVSFIDQLFFLKFFFSLTKEIFVICKMPLGINLFLSGQRRKARPEFKLVTGPRILVKL